MSEELANARSLFDAIVLEQHNDSVYPLFEIFKN